MKVRYLAAALLVAMLAVAASTASGGTSRKHATKLVIWLQNDAQNGWPEAVALANRNFKAQHPDVDVDVQYQTWGTHLTSSTPPSPAVTLRTSSRWVTPR